jgi:hypothetical protein
MFALGITSGNITGYAGGMAREHKFAPYAMEFLAPAGKPTFMKFG